RLLLSHDTAPSYVDPLSLHDALPICLGTPPCRQVLPPAIPRGTDRRAVLHSRPRVERRGAARAGRISRRVSGRSGAAGLRGLGRDRKSTRLNSSHVKISYAVFCLKKK